MGRASRLKAKRGKARESNAAIVRAFFEGTTKDERALLVALWHFGERDAHFPTGFARSFLEPLGVDIAARVVALYRETPSAARAALLAFVRAGVLTRVTTGDGSFGEPLFHFTERGAAFAALVENATLAARKAEIEALMEANKTPAP